MMAQLRFELVTPEKLLRSEDVHMVVVPGAEGDFGVLAGHAPFMSTIRPGAISVFKADGAPPERIFIDGGFAEVNEKGRSEEHTSELQSLMRISYAVFCLKKKKKK